MSVLIAERPAIGAPVRVRRGIGKEAVAEFVKPDPRWISAELKGADIVAPDGTTCMTLASEQAGQGRLHP